MKKNTIGELKLSPIKDEGKFVFYNDFITINGKVSKGDSVKLFVDRYEARNGKHHIDADKPASAQLVVRGERIVHNDLKGYATVEDLYDRVAELYKESFYFGNKV